MLFRSNYRDVRSLCTDAIFKLKVRQKDGESEPTLSDADIDSIIRKRSAFAIPGDSGPTPIASANNGHKPIRPHDDAEAVQRLLVHLSARPAKGRFDRKSAAMVLGFYTQSGTPATTELWGFIDKTLKPALQHDSPLVTDLSSDQKKLLREFAAPLRHRTTRFQAAG